MTNPSIEQPANLVAPILHGGKPLGVILLQRPQFFTENDARFLLRLASRSAAAIENARLYEAVQLANQAKSKFVSVVTHELRIPMTSIKGYSDLLRQGAVGPVNDMQLNFLDVIRNNVERMSALVSDLSDISRVETGRLKLENALIPVQKYFDDTLSSLRPRLQEKNQILETEIPADLPLVNADPNRLVQVLTNLISNAWKYTPSGGRIRVVALPQNDFVRIEVSDTGIGISQEDQAKLFSQFFRSDDPNVRSEQGWGLGLSVARRIVELMGGNMGCQSHLGEGSTFWFTLPTTS
jgi:signal transduction histidine kinase